MQRLSRISLASVVAVACAGARPQDAQQDATSPPARRSENAWVALLLARAAESDGDGQVSAEEWRALGADAGESAEGALDRRLLRARILESELDRNGDRRLGAADLREVLGGRLSSASAGGSASGAEGRRDRGRRSGSFADAVVVAEADTNGDGRVSDEEVERFLGGLSADESGALERPVVLGWMERAVAAVPADRNAFTPGVMLNTLDAAFDADGDGRVTGSDLDAFFRALDADGDGRLAAAELAPRRSAGDAANGRSAGADIPGAVEDPWTVTDEMRVRPPLMPWQRNLEDALALSRATGKPLLLCVNMDGENASDALAYGRYRDPAFAELARGFVPVLASPDRRQPRDRDDRGRRLPDLRFGRLVDEEHIVVEPQLFTRYFGGNRVAPRHVGVSPEGQVLFDLYLLNEHSRIDEKLREFGKPGPPPPAPSALTEDALLASPDAALREELERRFVAANEETRARLTGLALSTERETQHPELVWLALRDPSALVRQRGTAALLEHPEHAAVAQFPAAIAAAAGDTALRAALVEALGRAAPETASDQRLLDAGFYQRVASALDRTPAWLDVERWRLALAAAPRAVEQPPGGADLDATTALLERLEAAAASAPGDARLLVELAAVRTRAARIYLALGRNPTYFFADAIDACQAALQLAPEDGEALGYHAWASYMLSDLETAGALSQRALPQLLDDAGEPLAARVLGLVARTSAATLYAAIGAGEAWAPETIPDARAAYELLLLHPASTEEDWTSYLDLLAALSAFGEEADVLRRGLARHPLSGALHGYLRRQVLRDAGARALEAAYEEEFLASARAADAADVDWYHGLATLVAAEWDVGNRAEADALDAYGRCVALFQRALEAKPAITGSAAHYQALALAGASRLHAAAGRWSEAVSALLEALRTSPGSAATTDGLGKTPRATARELRAKLTAAGETGLAQELEDGVAEHDSQPSATPAADGVDSVDTGG